jgi:nucleotide-binding universal stress UspA family protein
VRDALFGSIAQQVVAQGKTPLLLIKPGLPDFKLDSILVPLDPDSEHDEGFPLAESLAKEFHSRLHLLSVIPTYATLSGKHVATSSLMPSSTAEFLNLRQETALEHLEEHLKGLGVKGISTSVEVARGDPAAVIARIANKNDLDLVLLSTHRKAGMDAFWALSVAHKVVQKVRVPLLLIPLSES